MFRTKKLLGRLDQNNLILFLILEGHYIPMKQLFYTTLFFFSSSMISYSACFTEKNTTKKESESISYVEDSSFNNEKNKRTLEYIHNYKEKILKHYRQDPDKIGYQIVSNCLDTLDFNLKASYVDPKSRLQEDGTMSPLNLGQFSIINNITSKSFYDKKDQILHLHINEHPKQISESFISVCSVLSNIQIYNGLIEQLEPEKTNAYKYAVLIELIDFFTNSMFRQYVFSPQIDQTELVQTSKFPPQINEVQKQEPFFSRYPLLSAKARFLKFLALAYFEGEQTLPNQYSSDFIKLLNVEDIVTDDKIYPTGMF